MSEVELGLTFESLSQKYDNFYVPAFAIKVGNPNSPPDQDVVKSNIPVFSVNVDRTLDAASTFSFTIDNAREKDGTNFPLLGNDSPLQVNHTVSIELGYGSELTSVITGTIESLDVSFPANGISQITVKGFDFLHKMTKTQHTPTTWGTRENPISYSDIVKALAAEHELTPEVEDTKEKHNEVKQEQEKDFQFIKNKLASRVGFEVYVRHKTLHFHPPKMDETTPITTLVWGLSLISFSPQIDNSRQVTEVEVRGWDPDNQEAVVGTAQAGSESGRSSGQSGGDMASTAGSNAAQHIWHPQIHTQQAAQDYAQAVLDRLANSLLTGTGECIGLPEIEPGHKIQLGGLGERYSMQYYVTKVTHTFGTSGFKTKFSIKENTIP